MRARIILVISVVISFVFLLVSGGNFLVDVTDGVVINEVIPDNFYLKADSQGNYHDIIELYNNGEETVYLEGYGLSDDEEVVHKWVFPDVSIESGEYLIVYMAGDEAEALSEATGDLYCNFKTKSSGEKIMLSDENGHLISSLVFEDMKADMSYGISDDGYDYFYQGSPGSENRGLVIDDIRTYMKDINLHPSFESGIYDQPIELSFDQKKDYEIRYTLDCSDPDTNSSVYKEPISIGYTSDLDIRISNIKTSFYPISDLESDKVNKGLVVKAQYFDGELPVGEMFCGTYFIWKEGNDRYSFDLVSLTTDDDNLYSSDKGIFVVGDEFAALAPENPDGSTPANYNQQGRDWEREVSVEFFDSEGRLEHIQNLGLRVAGGWSRAYDKKSLKLYARDGYGDESIDYEVFDDLKDVDGEIIDSFKKLGIRIGGNDYNYLLFRDLLGDSIAPEGLDYQAAKPIILFINGEYHGIYNIREGFDEGYLANHYNLDEDDVSIIKYFEGHVENYAGSEEEYQRYLDLVEFIENNDLAVMTNYDYVESMIDIDNLIDYYLLEAYIDNTDWPGNNVKIWRYTGKEKDDEKDGRYRFMLYDLDFGFALYGGGAQIRHDPFSFMEGYNSNQLYRHLIVNEEFRKKFLIRMCDLLNTDFSQENVNRELDRLIGIYEDELVENSHRWKFWAYNSLESYENNIVHGIREFIAKRDGYLYSYASEHYGLSKIVGIRLKADNGLVLVNDHYQKSEAELKYYPDYKLKLEALDNDDYQFAFWKIHDDSNTDLTADIDIKNPLLEIRPQDGTTVEAVYTLRD